MRSSSRSFRSLGQNSRSFRSLGQNSRFLEILAQNLNILGPRIQIWIHCHIRIFGIRGKRQGRATNQVQLKTKRRVKSKEIQRGRAMRKDVKTKKSNYFQNLLLNLNVNIAIYMYMYIVCSIYLSTWWFVCHD